MQVFSKPGQTVSCCFINPFLNHSYFTVRALGYSSDLCIFCPPLQLQLFFRRWISPKIFLSNLPLVAHFYNLLCILAFICYKGRLINHSLYLRFFRFLLSLYLDSIGSVLNFVYYQDYVAELIAARFPDTFRICELIIATDVSQSNYQTTIAAIQSSSVLVLPTPALISLVLPFNSFYTIAPYGGNKSEYYSEHISSPTPLPQSSIKSDDSFLPLSSINIIARAHSYRKGADILLNALVLLDKMLLSSSSTLSLDLIVCGSILEPKIRSEFLRVSALLKTSGIIRLSCKQLDQYSFSHLLVSSDIFIMPSRLESTSLAALEALWHGLPSILTAQCGVDDFVHLRHGILLGDHEPLSLARAIYTYCVHPEQLRFCRQSLIQDRPLFSWNRYFDSYREVLR